VAVRRLRRGEGANIRELRLRALTDAPSAFGSSLAEEIAYPVQHWNALAEQSESAAEGVVFVAVAGSSWLGMAGGYVSREDVTLASVWGMWVDPLVRRRGLGRQLLQAVLAWAGSCGVIRIELSVSDRAPGATALYSQLGFTPTGAHGQLRSDPSIEEIAMARTLHTSDSAP
jgi:GNAT superfamily N-acetyltransferase